MRYKIFILIAAIIGLFFFVLYLLLRQDTIVQPNTNNTVVPFPESGQQGNTPFVDGGSDVSSLFSLDRTIELQEFITTHLNKETYYVSSCDHDDTHRQASLVLNFKQNTQGLNTIESGMEYLEKNYPKIAPGIVSLLLDGEYSASEITVFPFTIIDRNNVIYRAPMLVSGQSEDLYHTWIGNTVTFSRSLECVTNVLAEFYGSH